MAAVRALHWLADRVFVCGFLQCSCSRGRRAQQQDWYSGEWQEELEEAGAVLLLWLQGKGQVRVKGCIQG